MSMTTFIIFGVLAIIFSVLSMIEIQIIKNQKQIILDLKGENQHLKMKLEAYKEENVRNYKGVIEDV